MRKDNPIDKAFTLLIGGFIGATVALLFATQKGEKTRRQLVKYGKKAGNRTQRFVGEIGESLDSVIGDILEAGSDGLEKGKKLTDRARTEILDVLDAGRTYIDEERGKLEKLMKG